MADDFFEAEPLDDEAVLELQLNQLQVEQYPLRRALEPSEVHNRLQSRKWVFDELTPVQKEVLFNALAELDEAAAKHEAARQVTEIVSRMTDRQMKQVRKNFLGAAKALLKLQHSITALGSPTTEAGATNRHRNLFLYFLLLRRVLRQLGPALQALKQVELPSTTEMLYVPLARLRDPRPDGAAKLQEFLVETCGLSTKDAGFRLAAISDTLWGKRIGNKAIEMRSSRARKRSGKKRITRDGKSSRKK